MKKIFTLAAAVLASMAMSADVIFSYTLTAAGEEGATYDAVGGTAKCLKPMGSGGSNEITIGTQTFYKFNSSSAWDFTLADAATFAEGDVVSITAACGTSAKSGKGVTLNGIALTGDFPASEANTLVYTVQAGDAIDGQTTIQVKRIDSDIKFGTISVERENVAPSTDPVESAEISGEAACMVGGSLELTCNAPKATSYQWSMNGAEIEGATAKKYTFAPAAAGEYSFTCAASNEYNLSPVVAAAHVVSVVDPADACGLLIKAVLNGGTSATMSGVIGGTFDTNLGSGKYKLDKGKYIGIQLAAGTFMAGDEVTITMSTAGQNYPCLFADKDRNNLLFLATETSDTLEYVITLPAEATGLTTLYLSRDGDDATYKWNPTVSSISVSRSCEASSNADIAKVTVNGYEVEESAGNKFEYTLSANYAEPTVSIALTLAHPKAHIKYDLSNPYEMTTPSAGTTSGQAFIIVAEDGTEKTYTVLVTKSATLSNNWFLSELSIDGYTLDPAFTPENNSYTITKPYGAANPEESAIHATTQDPNATIDHITINPTNILIMVVAEDGVAQNGYLIEIEEAAAKKDLLEATFSNGVHGYIAEGNINVPYLEGEEEPTFVSARFWNADGEPTAEMVEGNLVVTGIDAQQTSYTITYVPLTPMETSYDEITFSEVPSYIYSVYGFDAGKGVKFSKDVEEASNHRISEGKDRIYLALPAAGKVILTSGTGGERPVKILVNNVESPIKKTAASNAAIEIGLSQEHANFVAIESNGNSGDAGFIKLQLSEDIPTGINNAEEAVKTVKVIRNGQLFIEKNGVLYNAQGARL